MATENCPHCGQLITGVLSFRDAKRIIAVVCDVYGISRDVFLGKDRHHSIVEARHVAVFLIRRLTGASYPEIGRILGNRDHTTIMSSYKRAAGSGDRHLIERINVVMARLAPLAKTEPAALAEAVNG